MVLAVRAAGISDSTASITPQRMPISRFPRRDWLGSSTSPPLITKSNLSFGPIAAKAGDVDRAAAAVPARKWRRGGPDIVALPPVLRFLYFNDAMAGAFAQAAGRACGNATGSGPFY